MGRASAIEADTSESQIDLSTELLVLSKMQLRDMNESDRRNRGDRNGVVVLPCHCYKQRGGHIGTGNIFASDMMSDQIGIQNDGDHPARSTTRDRWPLARLAGRALIGWFPFLYWARDIVVDARFLRAVPRFINSARRYRILSAGGADFPLKWRHFYPQMYDAWSTAGSIPRHYFLQDIWAARRVYTSKVPVHHDLGGRVDGFIGHCLCFCKVAMLDVRAFPREVEGLEFRRADATRMADIPDGSVASLSCLHTIEHIGLGRYGDPIDPEGHIKAINELVRILARGGTLYVSVPVGRQRLEFNAHRVFDPVAFRDLFGALKLAEFAVIDDEDNLRENARPEDATGAFYACGLYRFQKA